MPAKKTQKVSQKKTKSKNSLSSKFSWNRKTMIIGVLLIAVVGAVLLRISSAQTPNTTYDRVRIVQVASAEVGNREYNDRVKQYTGRSDSPEWCAYFVSWVMKTSGYPLRTGDNWRVPAVFVSDNNLKDLFIQMGAYVEYPKKSAGSYPKLGDVLIYGRSHTGIVSQTNNGGRLYAIEGNSAAAGKPNSVARTEYASLDAAGIVGWGNVDALINRSPAKK